MVKVHVGPVHRGVAAGAVSLVVILRGLAGVAVDAVVVERHVLPAMCVVAVLAKAVVMLGRHLVVVTGDAIGKSAVVVAAGQVAIGAGLLRVAGAGVGLVAIGAGRVQAAKD